MTIERDKCYSSIPYPQVFIFRVMNTQKHILLFGAGKSASVLIDFLKQKAITNQWKITVADVNSDAILAKLGNHPLTEAVALDITDDLQRKELVRSADVVIALLPPSLQYRVALDCLHFGKHFLTASYTDPDIQLLANEIQQKGILFLCEMGLDPGIDHMSAMQMIHRIKSSGGKIHSFRSHCGGLVAAESDTNPWHYKFSWNPRNVVIAGKAGAVYLENGELKKQSYQTLFSDCELLAVPGQGPLCFYPNRDSLGYIPIYEMEEATRFIRTTLRHPDYCKGWNTVIQIGLTDEVELIHTDGLSIASFFEMHFSKSGIMVNELSSVQQKQFEFLGLSDTSLINKGDCTAADILQWILEKKWALQPEDKDLIIMVHEIGYSVPDNKGKRESATITAELIVTGENSVHTAMAKTVGLPLGIAASLILEGKIRETGLHIPTVPGIYVPVLEELERYGIGFVERDG